MYTQRRTPPEAGGIPQNYSGNAFRYPPIGTLGQQDVSKASSHAPPLDEAVPEQRQENYPVAIEAHPVKSEDRSGFLSLLGGHGIGNEELLLLGLCLLLSGDGGGLFGGRGGKGDVVPYLLLLLFLG